MGAVDADEKVEPAISWRACFEFLDNTVLLVSRYEAHDKKDERTHPCPKTGVQREVVTFASKAGACQETNGGPKQYGEEHVVHVATIGPIPICA